MRGATALAEFIAAKLLDVEPRDRRVWRNVSYALLAALAAATVTVIIYLMGTPGWETPLRPPGAGE